MKKNRSYRRSKKSSKNYNKTNRTIINVYIEKKTSDDNRTPFQKFLEYFLYIAFVFGFELSKSILTQLISSGECSITGITISLVFVAVIFALLKEKIKEALSEVIKKALASKKKIKRKRVRN